MESAKELWTGLIKRLGDESMAWRFDGVVDDEDGRKMGGGLTKW